MNKKTVFLGVAVLVVFLLIMNILTGTAGEAVLWGVTCLNCLIAMVGALFVWMLASDVLGKGGSFRKQFIVFGLIGMLLFGFAAAREMGVIKDAIGGTVTSSVLITDIDNEFGLHGIFGAQSHVEVILDNGEKIRFPITGDMVRTMVVGQRYTVTYYPNSRKLVRYY